MEQTRAGAPAALADPVWRADELEAQAYQVTLAPAEAAAFDRALTQGPAAWRELRRKHIPDTCASFVARVRRCLNESAGFCVVSGLPFDGSEEGARRVAFLAGLSLGTPVFQDAQGARLVDIRSTGADAHDAATYKVRADGTHVRPYETRAAFRLHADACDVAGLFCVRGAASGGTSTVVNALAVYRRLAETRPEVLAALHEPFYYARPRKPGEEVSYHGVPVFSWQDGYSKAHIVPDLILAAQLVPEVPRLSSAQREALDALMSVASNAELMLALRLAPGELLWLNNALVWHGREAYEDGPGNVRHLLRLWLATPDSRPLHPVHEPWFGNPAAGALRGGYLRDRLHELEE